MKGALVAPLVFVALAFACAASRLGYVSPWAVSALALAAAGATRPACGCAPSWLSACALGYALLVAVNAHFISPAYTPAGLYLPLLLALGFIVVRRFDDRGLLTAAVTAIGLGALLGTWGLVQIGPLGMARAQALFETPATYAAVLNLLLVPVLALGIAGRSRVAMLAVGSLLAAGLFAADSRGGLIALAAGMGAATIFSIRAKRFRWRDLGLALAMLVAGWVVATGLREWPSPEIAAPTDTARAESSLSRLELYALSWNAWRERPLAGTGYLTYRYSLEQGRAQVPSYGEANETWFVHNDYLQTLQELGPLGLAALLALAWLPALIAYRKVPALRADQQPAAIAAASALTAMACHALVDFPFYIPVCLLLYGALLGVLDRQLDEPRVAPAPDWKSRPWYRAARTGAALIGALILLRPVAAEAVAEWGLRKSVAGDGRGAAFWLGAARRIEPADWRYHWYAGQFWDAQAVGSSRREAANLAADSFTAGFDANPLEVRNLLGMISVHRRHRALLDSPADRRTFQAWLARAEGLAPFNTEVRRERALPGAAQ
jgi:O-antigen ligase